MTSLTDLVFAALVLGFVWLALENYRKAIWMRNLAQKARSVAVAAKGLADTLEMLRQGCEALDERQDAFARHLEAHDRGIETLRTLHEEHEALHDRMSAAQFGDLDDDPE